jgi:hypothetical protein
MLSRQTCKACGRPDKFNFHVGDEEWGRIVPPGLLTRVVCLGCFDEFAARAGETYSLVSLYFVGDQAVMELRPC